MTLRGYRGAELDPAGTYPKTMIQVVIMAVEIGCRAFWRVFPRMRNNGRRHTMGTGGLEMDPCHWWGRTVLYAEFEMNKKRAAKEKCHIASQLRGFPSLTAKNTSVQGSLPHRIPNPGVLQLDRSKCEQSSELATPHPKCGGSNT